MERELFAHQKSGVVRLFEILKYRRSALLADPPGGGKSAMAICLTRDFGSPCVLVLCPASLRENWRREFSMWRPKLITHTVYSKTQVECEAGFWHSSCAVIISYDLASQPSVLEILKDRKWSFLILDEAHALKTPKSKRTKAALLHLWDKSTYRLLLSGTPIPNGRAAEAYTTFSRLSPEDFRSWSAFEARYCIKEMTPRGPTWPRSKNLRELGQIARSKFMLRRSREEVMANLPPLLRSQVPLSIPELNLDPDFSSMGLICNHILQSEVLGIPLTSDHIATARRKLGILKIPESIRYIEEFLAEDPSQSLVVFAHHREVLSALTDVLSETHTVTSITGDTPPTARQAAVDAFQDGSARIFIGSITAASTGITLTKASTVIFVEADWVPSVNEQAEGRVLRLTQASSRVRAIYLYVPGSLDEVVTRSVIRKQRDITRALAA